MGIEHKFILQAGGESIEIEEPAGFDDLELSLKRDDKMHGMTFEAATSALQFYGDAADYLREQKKLNGLKAEVLFIASQRCSEGVYDEFEELIKGRLNFGKFKESCGKDCIITLPVESETCEVVLKNRFDQKVNIDLATGFDQTTVLPGYGGLNLVKSIPAKELFVSVEGYVADGGDHEELTSDTPSNFIYIRPVYDNQKNNSIDTGQLVPVSFYEMGDVNPSVRISPQLLYEDVVTCFTGNFEYRFRLKGRIQVPDPDNHDPRSLYLKVVMWDGQSHRDPIFGGPNFFLDATVLQTLTIFSGSGSGPIDESFDHFFQGNVILPPGWALYAYALLICSFKDNASVIIDWAKETYVNIFANKSCPPTDSDLYLVHETLSRATEAVTNYCMRVKSSYYGRTDSQPFSFSQDGCGGLRFLTSGLKIRKAKEDNFFASPKELIEGLQAIDNVGMGTEPDPDRPGRFLLRLESLDFFYTNEEILYHNAIPLASDEVDESRHYSKITVGYKKWEVGKINGLDEFNSNREYRTSLSSVSNTLDITSNLVAGGYPLEVTRQQSFAESGGADTSYDNEIFILTAKREAYMISPEQGGITDPANIYSPLTAWNFKLSPLRNLMRWFKSIINSYASIQNSGSRLFFGGGTGNMVAEGIVTVGFPYDDSCILERKTTRENQDLFAYDFSRTSDYTPLFKNEVVSYEYPMSIDDYRKIKEKPYGYIRFQCGSEDQKGYIKEVKYKPLKGMATFILKKKW